MIRGLRYDPLIKFGTLAFCVGWLLHVMAHNEVPADVGDGLMHFFYSQASWESPQFFLHHWGKPFFILLSSPFAQFGFNGMMLFNLLVFLSSVVVGYRILTHLGVNSWIQSLFPVVLLAANEYTTTIVGGLTEPLFNLSVLIAAWLLITGRYAWFAILVSMMPFMRSEGQLPLLLALMLLLWNRSYRMIPFLFTGFLLYSIIGLVVYHDFWWYFTMNPYATANDIYGNGTWDHYLISYRGYLGNPGLYVMIVGFLVMCYLIIKKRWQDLQWQWSFFAHGIFIGVVVVHSYFWAMGTNGSMGLNRVATQGMPLFVLLYLYYISRIPGRSNRISILFGIGSMAICFSLYKSIHFPIKSGLIEKEIYAAAAFLRKNTESTQKIYYHYPLLVYAFGENPFMKGSQMEFTYFHDLEADLGKTIKPGSFIVWDSHFGPVEAGLPLEKITKLTTLVKVGEFLYSEIDGIPGGIVIYQYIPDGDQLKHIEGLTRRVELTNIDVPAHKEFIDLLPLLPKFSKPTKIALELVPETDGLILVFDIHGGQYTPNDLKKGVVNRLSFNVPSTDKKALYIWNKELKSSGIKVEKLEVTEQKFHPILN